MTFRSLSLIHAATVAALAMTGCNAATEDDGATNVRRGGIGKADLVGSCVDTSCDGASPEGNCWCDDACETYGDCCDDYTAACELVQCGGFAGLPCPAGQVCVDYPLDDCSPETGGADCGGMCVDAPNQCGGLAGLACDAGQYCHYDADQTCGAADQLGECKAKPDFCAEVFSPVCGCDGVTYGNECKASAVGVSVASVGPCEAPADCEAGGGFCTGGGACPADTVEADGTCDGGGTCCKPWVLPPAAPTCAGNCGGAAPGGACWCDASCESYGDCCDDYAAECA